MLGSDAGMVSCGVMGLLTLIHPLKWVAPLIPILPMKHFEFVESPVPLIAGLVRDDNDEEIIDALHILKLCNDEDNGTITIVFDVSEREVYIANCNITAQKELLLPGAEALVQTLKSLFPKESLILENLSNDKKSKASYTQSLYAVSTHQIYYAKSIQKHLYDHIQTILEMSLTKQFNLQKTISYDLSGIEQKPLCIPTHKKNKNILSNKSSPTNNNNNNNGNELQVPIFDNSEIEGNNNDMLEEDNNNDNNADWISNISTHPSFKRSFSERSFFDKPMPQSPYQSYHNTTNTPSSQHNNNSINLSSSHHNMPFSPPSSVKNNIHMSQAVRRSLAKSLNIQSLKWTEIGGIILGKIALFLMIIRHSLVCGYYINIRTMNV